MKTTKKQFDEFVAECERLQPLMGLTTYRIRYWHEPLDGGSVARCGVNPNECLCDMYFSTDSGCDDPQPLICARHEMSHLLLTRLSLYGRLRFGISPEVIEMEEESLANILEKLI